MWLNTSFPLGNSNYLNVSIGPYPTQQNEVSAEKPIIPELDKNFPESYKQEVHYRVCKRPPLVYTCSHLISLTLER